MDRSEDFKEIFKDKNIITDKFYEYLLSNGFFSQVASTKFHGDYPGGLYDHSKNVVRMLLKFSKNNNIKWEREESPYIIGMFHDLCKIDNYTMHENGFITYNKEKKNLGHGTRSVKLLSNFIDLTEEEKICIINHMGAYETDRWNEYDLAIREYPNVLWVHMADMVASKLMEKGRMQINEENTSKNVHSK